MYVYPQKETFDKYEEPRLHMEALLATHLIEFGVHIRILIPLESAGIRTLGDLIKQSRRKLKKIKQLGDRSIHKLETLLEYHSLSFAED